MSRIRRMAAGAWDLVRLPLRHPGWFSRNLAQRMMDLRAAGTAEYGHHLPLIYHHRLDPALVSLPVEVGSCPIDLPKATIVCRFCKLLRPRKVLEIGTFRGGMTYHIARNTGDDCTIWTLDVPRLQLAGQTDRMIETDVAMAMIPESEVVEYWKGTPERRRIVQLWGDSLTYDFSALGPMDLIYIDGSHAEPWVRKDTENAFRLLAPTGAILWDDCLWSDVQRVLGRFAADRPIYRFEDGSTAGYLRRDGRPVTVPGAGARGVESPHSDVEPPPPQPLGSPGQSAPAGRTPG